MYILIDCDNFFVSCERAFQPHLQNRAVVVLSNNDGCVVARSNEAKKLGIAMGSPYFKIAEDLRAQGGLALSSNYELYADMSQRVMNLIKERFPNLEIYSIDEAFAEVKETNNLVEEALSLRNTILQQTGISVSIGIAPSKTLCKIAGERAKPLTRDKVCYFHDAETTAKILSEVEVGDVWGIGRNLKPRLNFLGIFTAQDLVRAPAGLIRRHFGINLEKTVMELQGISCLAHEHNGEQQSLMCSRSFEHEVQTFEELRRILGEFTDSACQRLRRQGGEAGGIIVYLSTNRFSKNEEFYQNSSFIGLNRASALTSKFLKAMEQGLREIYREGKHYKRAGITLTEIRKRGAGQRNLFETEADENREQKLLQAVDDLNEKLGAKTIRFGSLSQEIKHFIRREHRSQSYTTSWQELLKVH